jgi:hypothetical protein
LRRAALVLVLLAGACALPARAPLRPEPGPEPPPTPEFPFAFAWTAQGGVAVHTDTGEVLIPKPFTRLNVLGVDSLGVLVRCLYCIPALEGRVQQDDIVHEALSPEAASRLGLAEFALAVREAASRRDQQALGPVMARDFTFGFEGGGGPVDAFHRWRFQGFRSLDNLPPLLDRGLATRDSVVWTAPPVFLTDPEYHGLRAGFRRGMHGRWEWIYLVGGE